MSQIFFSYSRKDSEYVDQLIEQLEAQSIDIWVDRGDILAGEAWRRSIVEAIMDCQVFVIVLSPNSVTSENVTKELTLAEQHKKPVLPLVIQDVPIPPALDYQLAGLHYQTFAEGRYEDNFERLTHSLGALGVATKPGPVAEPERIPEPEIEPKPEIILPLTKPEAETQPADLEPGFEAEPAPEIVLPSSKPEIETQLPEQRGEPEPPPSVYIQDTSAQFGETAPPRQKIPVWLWAGGGLVVITVCLIGAIIVFSSTFGGGSQKNDPTTTDEFTLVLSPEVTEPILTPIPPHIMDDSEVPMVLVPAGSFTMGTNRADAFKECEKVNPSLTCEAFYFGDEEPVRSVTLDYDYYIDQFEVTNMRYDACVTAGACDPPWNFSLIPGTQYFRNAKYNQYPVVNVTWDSANDYCEWRGGRLPTETEWEKAARGIDDDRLYPWGNTLDGDRGNFCDSNCSNSWANRTFNDGYEITAPVGQFPSGASPYGAEDMAGNVSEWVADRYGPYPGGEADVDSNFYGETRIRRGGSWYSLGSDLRVSRRDKNLPAPQVVDPNSELGKIGFRCVLDIP